MGKKKYLTEEERKAAKSEYNKQYRQKNKEKIAKRKAEHYQENKEKILEHKAAFYQDNKEKFAAKNAEYYQDNKEKIAKRDAQYYSTQKGRAVNLASSYRTEDKEKNRGECTITGDWIVENIFSKSCHYCGESDWTKLGCDRKDSSLPHTPDNVVPCCRHCNSKKYTTPYDEFMKLIGKVTGN